MYIGAPKDIRIVVFPLLGNLDMFISWDNVSCGGEQECHRHIGGGIAEDTGRVSNSDAAFSASLDMDVIITDPDDGDCFEIWRSCDHLWGDRFVSISH